MQGNNKGSRIRLVIFDLDGTITQPYLDFDRIRREIGITDPDTLILDYVQTLSEDEQKRAFEILDRFEDEAAANAEPRKGAVTLMEELSSRGVKTAIFTRNSRKSVETVLEKFGIKVDAVITRSDGPPKPAPDSVHSLLSRFGISSHQAIIVGDFRVDIEAGKKAGLRTVLLDDGSEGRLPDLKPDLRVENLLDILPAIERWGKE